MDNNQFNFANCNSLAIMGGTFDPIHNGHLLVAQEVFSNLKVEKIIFMPTGVSKHKKTSIATKEHRYMMTLLATNSNSNFYVSSMETERMGNTYTADTLNDIKKICNSNTKIYFVVGADTLQNMTTWKSPRDVFSNCEIVVVNRASNNIKNLSLQIQTLKETYSCLIHYIEMPSFEISSTEIRERVQCDKSIKYLLPEVVEQYIYKNRLYSYPYKIEYIASKVKNKLSKRRYCHTEGVVKEAIKLAKCHGVEADKAHIAAILHDYAKELSTKDMLELCDKYSIRLSEFCNNNVNLMHGAIASELCKMEFGIVDDDIINAIKNHTIGHANMSLLEKIIFVADIVEPSRFGISESVDNDILKIRYVMCTNIDKAMLLALEMKINYTKGKTDVHSEALEALQYFRNIENACES
jgi:nicotinate-nucleotide adenylyltransferase